MKYTNDEALKEILKRSRGVKQKRDQRAIRYLTGVSTALTAILVAVVFIFPAYVSGSYSGGTVYGAFLLSGEAGGYVLAAVIAFMLGVTVTLLCLKKRGIDVFAGQGISDK